jgi:hypothetical protein
MLKHRPKVASDGLFLGYGARKLVQFSISKMELVKVCPKVCDGWIAGLTMSQSKQNIYVADSWGN